MDVIATPLFALVGIALAALATPLAALIALLTGPLHQDVAAEAGDWDNLNVADQAVNSVADFFGVGAGLCEPTTKEQTSGEVLFGQPKQSGSSLPTLLPWFTAGQYEGRTVPCKPLTFSK
ncbi:hypothetical protein C1Y63_05730 [Corynebacterium sp. 13CS0277]|uniref:hypothetical protein n=1 Tax=Corynebacterium sp. 13CS0277 TaxID=2071994 RepID=UPI000D0356F9|nr:hypothetical protein [Corynebacterium sp. 13CS0277]PRQ11502.1 hypothetical protein C1Y63_05730 [Corynebacterium sp. 13CS0277]